MLCFSIFLKYFTVGVATLYGSKWKHYTAWTNKSHRGWVYPLEPLTSFSSGRMARPHTDKWAGSHRWPSAFAQSWYTNCNAQNMSAHRDTVAGFLWSPTGMECDLQLKRTFSNNGIMQAVRTTILPRCSAHNRQLSWLTRYPAELI